MRASSQSGARTKRFSVRATSRQEEVIRSAAQRQGISVAEFILKSAYEQAEQTLTDKTHFVLNDAQWNEFMRALDEPPRELPALKKLFKDPPIAESR